MKDERELRDYIQNFQDEDAQEKYEQKRMYKRAIEKSNAKKKTADKVNTGEIIADK